MTRPTLFIILFITGCAGNPPTAVTPCKTDCISYEDGYQWALRANLADARNCEGYASDFVRGCKQEVNDLQQSFAPRQGF